MYFIFSMSATLSCCAKDRNEVAAKDDNLYHVKYLFSVDNVKVYRFCVVSRVHYFIVGSDGATVSSQPRQVGKMKNYAEERIDAKYVK